MVHAFGWKRRDLVIEWSYRKNAKTDKKLVVKCFVAVKVGWELIEAVEAEVTAPKEEYEVARVAVFEAAARRTRF